MTRRDDSDEEMKSTATPASSAFRPHLAYSASEHRESLAEAMLPPRGRHF